MLSTPLLIRECHKIDPTVVLRRAALVRHRFQGESCAFYGKNVVVNPHMHFQNVPYPYKDMKNTQRNCKVKPFG
jgi:hypothetical protein